MDLITNIQSTKTLNDDGSLTLNIDIDAMTHKAMQHVMANVEEWIVNAIFTRGDIAINKVYKAELEKHLNAGTLTSDMTKESLVLNSVLPDRSVVLPMDISGN